MVAYSCKASFYTVGLLEAVAFNNSRGCSFQKRCHSSCDLNQQDQRHQRVLIATPSPGKGLRFLYCEPSYPMSAIIKASVEPATPAALLPTFASGAGCKKYPAIK